MRVCGIHTRLQAVIDKSGGYHVPSAARLLMKEYQLNNYEIAYEMALNPSIRFEIEAVGIEAVVELTKKSISLRKRKFNMMLRRLSWESSLRH